MRAFSKVIQQQYFPVLLSSCLFIPLPSLLSMLLIPHHRFLLFLLFFLLSRVLWGISYSILMSVNSVHGYYVPSRRPSHPESNRKHFGENGSWLLRNFTVGARWNGTSQESLLFLPLLGPIKAVPLLPDSASPHTTYLLLILQRKKWIYNHSQEILIKFYSHTHILHSKKTKRKKKPHWNRHKVHSKKKKGKYPTTTFCSLR